MNKEILYEAMLSPAKLSEVPREELEKVAREYPYFTSAQVLLARSYRLSGDHRFSDQLQTASHCSGDRLSLYHLMKDEGVTRELEIQIVPLEQESAPEEIQPQTIPTLETVELINTIEQEPLETFENTIAVAARNTKTEVAIEPEETKLIVEIAVEIPEIVESIPPQSNKYERDILEDFILARAVHSSIELEVGESDDEPIQQKQTEPLAEEEEEIEVDSFANWVAKRAKAIGYQDDTLKTPHLPRYEDAKGVMQPPSDSRKKTQQQLIDRFIQTSPRITPGKSEAYDLENVARTSITEDLSVVSETMAVLLASQGKKEKARRVYRKLMELHPEKSVYFAAQLKNLDKFK
ncbi:MAG: hypothetical protein SGI87_01915 [Flavobacteriales bacterium]|nr:hypothetical protein [Flavobacteriales bacterium]